MPLEIIILLGIIVVLLLISVLKSNRIIKITLGSYLLLPFSIGLGEFILQVAKQLNLHPESHFLGINYATFAKLLNNAQPTIVLILFLLLIWFVAKNSYLEVATSSDPLRKQFQTIIRSILCVGSMVSYFYFSLAHFQGEMFHYLFMNKAMALYTPRFPLVGLVSSLMVVLVSSRLSFRRLKKSHDELS